MMHIDILCLTPSYSSPTAWAVASRHVSFWNVPGMLTIIPWTFADTISSDQLLGSLAFGSFLLQRCLQLMNPVLSPVPDALRLFSGWQRPLLAAVVLLHQLCSHRLHRDLRPAAVWKAASQMGTIHRCLYKAGREPSYDCHNANPFTQKDGVHNTRFAWQVSGLAGLYPMDRHSKSVEYQG